MGNHYFETQPSSESKEKQVQCTLFDRPFSFIVDSGVFSKKGLDYGSRLLIEQVKLASSSRVLDLGCGYGPIGIALAVTYPDIHVTMVDINERAIHLAQKNSERNGVRNRVKVQVSDGFAGIDKDQKFDTIISNPPIRIGKKTIYQWFQESTHYLQTGGALWIVIRKQQGAASLLKELYQYFDTVEPIIRKKGYWVIRAVIN